MITANKAVTEYLAEYKRSESSRQLFLYIIMIDDFRDMTAALGRVSAVKVLTDFRDDIEGLNGKSGLVLSGENHIAIWTQHNIDGFLLERATGFTTVINNTPMSLIFNIGATHTSSKESINTDALFNEARTAAYNAQYLDEERVLYFQPLQMSTAYSRFKLRNDLLYAIKNQQLEIFLQPKVNIKTGETVGFEALLRWNHPEKGLVSPAAFIPTAPQARLLMRLDLYVMRKVVGLIANNRLNDLPISVNISPTSLVSPLFVGELTTALTTSNINRALFEIEVTENSSLIAHDLDESLLKLNKLGITLSVDDFGSGYSSLNYLLALPFDIIKIDRFFVEHIVVDDDAFTLLKGLVSTLHGLRKRVLIEGVESAQQVELLTTMGVEYAQGFYFGQPQSAELVIR